MTRTLLRSCCFLAAASILLASAFKADAARPRVTRMHGDRQEHKLIREPQTESQVTNAKAADNTRACSGNGDEVCTLPGLNGNPHVRMRSGYVTVSEVSDRQLWYLVADREDPEEEGREVEEGQVAQEGARRRRARDNTAPAPVLLWLTGGPGCSSLDAFIYEHGPFKFSYEDSASEGSGGADGADQANIGNWGGKNEGEDRKIVTLKPNPHSWTKVATVIYVDSPAGTGMSYSGRPSIDYHTNDEYTIADLVTFLKGLTERYPELAAAPFYISGESYGGVFVPLLAKELVRVNKERKGAGQAPLVDLQGYAIGNPVTDDVIDGNAQMWFAADMGFVDPPTWRTIRKACNDMFWNATSDSDCYAAQAVVKDDLWDLNWYDVLDACMKYDHDNPAAAKQAQQAQRAARTAADRARRFAWPFTARLAAPDPQPDAQQPAAEAELEESRRGGRKLWGPWLRHVVPCMDRRIAMDWLNRDEVRTALHAAPSSAIGEWAPCSDVLYYRLDTMELVPVHEQLVREGLRALVYTGDHDMVVPHTGTRAWVFDKADLGGAEGPLHTWMYNGQVAGFTTRFKAGTGLRFASVKGAGHMVPQSKPALALRLLESFLYDEEL